MNKATLNLFNAIQADSNTKVKDLMFEKTIKHGFVFAPDFKGVINDALIKTVSEVIGISGVKANASFHKSWKIIKDTPQEELWIQAMVHYMTTYGFQAMDMYRDETIFIPNEELDLPEIKDDIKLIVVKSLTQEQVLDGIFSLASGIALKEETLIDIMTIVEGQENEWDSEITENIHNRELKVRMYDHFDIVPSEPVEFLRFVITKLTDESLLIKNDYLIAKIKDTDSSLHKKTLDKLINKAPDNLAEIFFRFKPIFLALKSVSDNKTFFNQLRKKADTLHKPMGEDYLNSITSRLKHGDSIIHDELQNELGKASIFRKIRLAYALNYRTKENDGIVYKVRNGRGFATEFNFKQYESAQTILGFVVKSIEESLNVKDKVLYIPKNVNYALPATEKMFIGNFPTGTYIAVPEDMMVGIHWFNTDKKEVDLDLSTISASGKTGWDSIYSSEGQGVLFSGDITSAPKPKGASELFYIKEGVTEDKIMMVNYYNFDSGDEVDMKLFVAHEKADSLENDYMVDVNNIIGSTNVNISKRQNVLGLITCVGDENRFYFAGMSVGSGISASDNDQATISRKYLVSSLVDTLDFKEIMSNAGAKVVDEKPEEGEFVDLSPEALDKTTIINLINHE